MNRRHQNIIIITIFIVLSCTNNSLQDDDDFFDKPLCPIGFKLAYTKDRDPICYLRKGPESFEDIFKDCTGNLYTYKLYLSLNFTEEKYPLWTEYKSVYPGGPFEDWTYINYSDDIELMGEVKFDISLNTEEEFCIVKDPRHGLIAIRCNEDHYRYCFVEPYSSKDLTTGCEQLPGYVRFWSPRATCLTVVQGKGNTSFRGSWKEAQDSCEKRDGAILHRGWRYANSPLFFESGLNRTDPLGIVFISPGDKMLWADVEDGNNEVPDSEWSFRDGGPHSIDASLVALHNDAWYLVNNTYRFYHVICERSIHLRSVEMNLRVDGRRKVILRVNDSLEEDDIKCFTDSKNYVPEYVKLSRIDHSNDFELDASADGYYWCKNIDSINYHLTESNKVLFINNDRDITDIYAIKVKFKDRYKFTDARIRKSKEEKIEKLKQYIYNRQPSYIRHAKHYDKNKILSKDKIKRIYFDGRTMLLHVRLDKDLQPVLPGASEDVVVEYMRPVYFCVVNNIVDITLSLGQNSTMGCENHLCLGDFNQGVQLVTTRAYAGCTTVAPTSTSTEAATTESIAEVTTPRFGQFGDDDSDADRFENRNTVAITPTYNDSILSRTVVNPDTTTFITESPDEAKTESNKKPPCRTTTIPPTTEPTTEDSSEENDSTEIPLPPEEQLQQIIDDIGQLLNNGSIPVLIDNIQETFVQVDSLLEIDDNLEIPGKLLHLLDEMGARAYLNGSQVASAVMNNIAIFMADTNPQAPVRGLRLATRDQDSFTNDTFDVITGTLSDSELATNESEAVVYLPESVANSARRVSFVIFRNDRAFHDSQPSVAVNSRIFSVKVENLTEFERGEVIDIHLRPMFLEPQRETGRACGFWQFLDDGSGYWSQEGCRLIKTAEGMLDICRCNHLTHFAEILVPRTVFSEQNEDALQILSIIGCILSILGVGMVGLTALLFRSWRRDYSNKIWLQLCVAIFLLSICFLITVFAKFDTYNIPCMLLGVALHYSVLSSFCWMLVAAVLSYRRLVLVFTRSGSHKLLKASAFAWGVPFAIIGILLSIAPHSYETQFEEISPSSSFCYPSGLALWLTVYAPIAIMLLVNWTLFVLIVRSVFASRRIQRHGDSNEALRCASVSCLLVFLFGLPWIFGLFGYNVVAAYFFTLMATFQGLVLFIFFVVGNKKTRDLWLNKLKIKQTRKVPVTSSTFTNKSSGGWKPGAGGPSSMEAGSSKPRSLSSPDDSRFS